MAILRGLCTITEVELYTRPANNVTYSTSTKPTLAQVENFIDRAIDYIYGRCEAEGILTPVTETVTRRIVADLNAIYTAILILLTLHSATHPNVNELTKALQELFKERWTELTLNTLLSTTATNDLRKVIPMDTGVYSKTADLWDAANEYTGELTPWFTREKEW